MRFTLHKLEVIKSKLAMINKNWSEWTFIQFVQALGTWTKNNPVKEKSGVRSPKEKGRSFLAKKDDAANRGSKGCLYCSSDAHRAIDCNKIVKSDDRKRILAEKHLCFNCTGTKHRAAECKSKGKCQTCQGRHHTSICDKRQKMDEPGMTASLVGQSKVVHPVVVCALTGTNFELYWTVVPAILTLQRQLLISVVQK